MKKYIIPAIYILLVILLASMYTILYRNFFIDVSSHSERLIRLNLIMTFISMLIPMYFIYVYLPFLRKRPLLIIYPIGYILSGIFGWFYFRTQLAFPMILSNLLIVILLLIGLMNVVSWGLLFLLERESKQLKTSFLIVSIISGFSFLVSNRLVSQFVIRWVDFERMSTYFTATRYIQYIVNITLAIMLYTLYKSKEDQEILQPDELAFGSTLFSYDE